MRQGAGRRRAALSNNGLRRRPGAAAPPTSAVGRGALLHRPQVPPLREGPRQTDAEAAAVPGAAEGLLSVVHRVVCPCAALGRGEGGRGEGGEEHKQSNDPHNKQHNPQYANYWAPLTHKRHIPPHSAQPQHTNDWAPRTRKRHQQEHRPQRPTERSDPTQHAKGRTGDCPGPRKETTTGRNVTRGGGG